LVAILSTEGQADVYTYGFECITNSKPPHAQTGQAELFVDVGNTLPDGTSLPKNQALFTFRNIGPSASSITDIYFDDGSLSGIRCLIDNDDGFGSPLRYGDSGVDFSAGASPGNLPGHDEIDPPFERQKAF
jgi:hypothetical protein